jgi:outer membrane protein OmpA-like peptidoglycan-associated protein
LGRLLGPRNSFQIEETIVKSIRALLVMLLGIAPAFVFAQSAQRSAIASSDVLSQISMFNYQAGPKSDLLFRGTPIAAIAEGKGGVEFDNGNAAISVDIKDLPAPTTLGPYTTYVLWTLTPDGRAANQGVVAGVAGGKGALKTQYGASQFALIITAEPHFAVTAPSNMIVLYNVADDVKGQETKVTSLTERSDYSTLAAIEIDEKANPAEIVQARYSTAIAAAAGAQEYAAEPYATAQLKLAAAEKAMSGKRSERETMPSLAREAVIAGEDARRAAMTGKAAADEAAKRKAAAEAAARVAAADAAVKGAAAARADLLTRLNSALPTRETDRGLVSEIGGVQFATGTADLSAAARESLARFSGIVASYPDLRFTIEGHTDNTGSLATNNELSLRRAIAVRDYLIAQRIPASSIDAQGLGPSRPVASNDTADGRAQNRRVVIVISGGMLTAN